MIFLLVNDELGAFVINWKVKLISKVILYLNVLFIFSENFFSYDPQDVPEEPVESKPKS
jgi:hypothetical protein